MLRKEIFLVVLATLLASTAIGQKSRNWSDKVQERMRGKDIEYVKLTVVALQGKDKVEDVELRFYASGVNPALIRTNSTGRATYLLDINKEYLVVASKSNYLTKSISFSTSIEDSLLADVWGNFKFQVEMVPLDDIGDEEDEIEEKVEVEEELSGKDSVNATRKMAEPVARLSMNNASSRFTPTTFRYESLPDPDLVRGLVNRTGDDIVSRNTKEYDLELAKKEQLRLLAEAERLKDAAAKAKQDLANAQLQIEEQKRQEEEALAEAERIKMEMEELSRMEAEKEAMAAELEREERVRSLNLLLDEYSITSGDLLAQLSDLDQAINQSQANAISASELIDPTMLDPRDDVQLLRGAVASKEAEIERATYQISEHTFLSKRHELQIELINVNDEMLKIHNVLKALGEDIPTMESENSGSIAIERNGSKEELAKAAAERSELHQLQLELAELRTRLNSAESSFALASKERVEQERKLFELLEIKSTELESKRAVALSKQADWNAAQETVSSLKSNLTEMQLEESSNELEGLKKELGILRTELKIEFMKMEEAEAAKILLSSEGQYVNAGNEYNSVLDDLIGIDVMDLPEKVNLATIKSDLDEIDIEKSIVNCTQRITQLKREIEDKSSSLELANAAVLKQEAAAKEAAIIASLKRKEELNRQKVLAGAESQKKLLALQQQAKERELLAAANQKTIETALQDQADIALKADEIASVREKLEADKLAEKEAMEAEADRVVDIIHDTEVKGKETIEYIVVVTKSREIVYSKSTIGESASKYYKDGNPITNRTFTLETDRRIRSLEGQN